MMYENKMYGDKYQDRHGRIEKRKKNILFTFAMCV